MDLDRFRTATERHAVVNRRWFDAPPDPWAPVRVDPAAVDESVRVSREWGLGLVTGGEWDRPDNRTPVGELPIAEGLRQRFEQGRDREETVYLDWAAELIAEDGAFRGWRDVESFRAGRCDALEELYDDIRRRGYRPNDETADDTSEDIESVHDLEPLVAIGQAGEVRWRDSTGS